MFPFFQTKAQEESQLIKLDISLIRPNPDQPRRIFEESALRELANSITEYGLMQPVLVRWTGEYYELIAGERRWRACKLAGLTQIDAILSDAGAVQSACMALVENLQRENLHFFEEAESYLSLMRMYGMTQEELARRLGRNQSTVANKLRVLRLPETVKKAVLDCRLTERHARALLRLTREEDQIEAVQQIRARLLSVKDTDQLIDQMLTRDREERHARRPRRVTRAVRDYRLFVNTLKAAFSELRTAGVEADFRVVETDNEYTVTVALPKQSVIEGGQSAQA